jgi:hypothetical protein
MATMKRVFIIAVLFLIPALAKADSVWTFDGELTDPGSWHGGFPQFNTHCNCDLDGVRSLFSHQSPAVLHRIAGCFFIWVR